MSRIKAYGRFFRVLFRIYTTIYLSILYTIKHTGEYCSAKQAEAKAAREGQLHVCFVLFSTYPKPPSPAGIILEA
jgi:hypothetical protein